MVRVPGLRTAAVAVVGACAIAALAAGASARSLISNARGCKRHRRLREHVERPEARPARRHELPRLPGPPPDLRHARQLQRQAAAHARSRDQLVVLERREDHHLPATQERELHGRHDLHIGERGGLAQSREGSEDRRCGLVVHRVGDEDRARRHLRREAAALAPGRLGAERPHLAQPGDAVDQVDCRRNALQDAGRDGALPVRRAGCRTIHSRSTRTRAGGAAR